MQKLKNSIKGIFGLLSPLLMVGMIPAIVGSIAILIFIR